MTVSVIVARCGSERSDNN